MYYYKMYGVKIASDIQFYQLVDCNDNEPVDITIQSGEIAQFIYEKEKQGLKYEFKDEISWLVNSTCYLYVENGRKLTYKLKEDQNFMYLKAYILGWGMSMLALQRGIIAMHCSAVADDKGAILIVGESGSGKSTLTEALLSFGYRFMADDIAWVSDMQENVFASPAYPYRKLCSDAAVAQGYNIENLQYIDEGKDKYLVPYNGEFSTKPVRLKGLIMLGIVDGEEVICKEAKGLLKFQIVANNQFLRALLGADKYSPQIGQKCLKIASAIPIFYILRPSQKNTIQEVITQTINIASAFN